MATVRKKQVDRFKQSKRQLYIFGGASFFLCLLSMYLFGEESVPIVVATIGGNFTLATGQTIITNYAESKNPEYHYEDDFMEGVQ